MRDVYSKYRLKDRQGGYISKHVVTVPARALCVSNGRIGSCKFSLLALCQQGKPIQHEAILLTAFIKIITARHKYIIDTKVYWRLGISISIRASLVDSFLDLLRLLVYFYGLL